MTTAGYFRHPDNEAAEQYAESLGVFARYGNSDCSVYIAENFTAALKITQAAGLQLPERIVDEPRWFKAHYPNHHHLLHATSERALVRINSHSEYWEDHGEKAQEITRRLYMKQMWSSASELHVALHELMHVAQYLRNPTQWFTLESQGFSEATGDIIRLQVSKYGAEDAIEFLAEAGVGSLIGRTFPGEIMEIYRSLGGIPI